MIGFVVFILDIILYLRKKYVWQLFFFAAFCYRFLSLIPNNYVGLEGPDFAVAAMALAFVVGNKKIFMPNEDATLRNSFIAMFVFLLLCMVYTLLRYDLSFSNVLMAARMSFILLAYFLMKRISPDWIERMLSLLYCVTLVHSVLFIVEVISGLPILGEEAKFDFTTGTYRYLNWPPLHEFFLYLSVLFPNYIKLPKIFERYKKYSTILFMAVVILTFGRFRVVSTFGVLVCGLIAKGRVKSVLTVAALFAILAIPLGEGLKNRMNNDGETGSDVEAILNGGVQKYANTGIKEGGTLTYRFAMLYERIAVLSDRSIGDQIFGYGLEYNPLSESVLVDFKVGESLRTADIAYVNLIRLYGFGGTLIFMLIWFRMMYLNRRYKNKHPLAFCNYLFIISTLLIHVTGAQLSFFSWMFLPLILTFYVMNTNVKQRIPE